MSGAAATAEPANSPSAAAPKRPQTFMFFSPCLGLPVPRGLCGDNDAPCERKRQCFASSAPTVRLARGPGSSASTTGRGDHQMKAGLQVIAAVSALLITTTIASGEDPALPAQCAALLPMMQQQMMQAMQSGMGKTAGMAEGSMTQAGDMPAMTELSGAGKAYMDAMQKMDPSMMEGVQAKDPDVAFIK